MNLNLYLCTDAANVIGKQLQNKKVITINLKRDVNIIAPVLIIRNIDNLDVNQFNYAEITLLNRLYFIDRIDNIGSDLWRLQLNCDVLETYKADILASNARFDRVIQDGDYFDANLDKRVDATITWHESNVEMVAGKSMILSTVGTGA